jgi:hypothetical protein
MFVHEICTTSSFQTYELPAKLPLDLIHSRLDVSYHETIQIWIAMDAFQDPAISYAGYRGVAEIA